MEVLNTAFKGKQFRVKAGLKIGSGPDCQIRAQADGMQEVHVRFYDDGPRHMVEIASDKAHLFVNGKDVMRGEIRHNDQITVGPLKLKVIDDAKVSQSALRLDQLMADFEAHSGDEVYDFAKEDLFYLSTKDPQLRQTVSFVIPSKDKFIDQSQVFLARLVKQSGMDESKIDAFMTCAKELILNAHRHGHKYDESKKIVLRYRDLGDKLSLSIEDQGAGFDHGAVIDAMKKKDAAQAARERYQAGGFGGLGFKMITNMADTLAYNDSGNTVTYTVNKKEPE
ncbi:MAG: ATP-binding protein [Planctomycetes bacterium]|nr:ATP-binding protein [Planctomycetota bacterium]